MTGSISIMVLLVLWVTLLLGSLVFFLLIMKGAS